MSTVKGTPGPMPPSKAWQTLMQGAVIKTCGQYGEGEYVEFRIPAITQGNDTLCGGEIIPLEAALIRAALELRLDQIGVIDVAVQPLGPETNTAE